MRLVASDVRVRYPRARHEVLRGASCEVLQGQSLAIVGPSGSGKSTLLGVLGGLISPDAGQVEIQDGHARGISGNVRPRNVTAWVFQTMNVLAERSALDNVMVAALVRFGNREAAREEALRCLDAVELSEHTLVPTRALSGGQVQRVVIARAMASGRPFILADEPTGQLDRATSQRVMDVLVNTGDPVGIVIVTHDPDVAERCDVRVRIDDGRVVPL